MINRTFDIGLRLAAAAATIVVAVGCGEDRPREEALPARGAVLIAAGDIAGCDTDGDEATAQILDREEFDTVAVLGDNAYEYGTEAQYRMCYGPTWGLYKSRTRPAVGNHEYAQPNAPGYFEYFGRAAGAPGEGWYSYDLAGWHVVVLNSMCEEVGCGPRSAQARWLEEDLRRSSAVCTLAYWHHPRFSSGAKHGDHPEVEHFWRVLQRHGADLILSAHDHLYERFAPLTPSGEPDAATGIAQFVVGTGGKSLRPFGEIKPGSIVRQADTYGVLKLTLAPRGYSWRFLPVQGATFTDAGRAECR